MKNIFKIFWSDEAQKNLMAINNYISSIIPKVNGTTDQPAIRTCI